jgi:predicted DNA-binding transcriptional regulator AlpA
MTILEEPLISVAEAAKEIHIKPPTLDQWRKRNQGPAYVKVGKLVFYRASDIRAWLQTRVVRPTEQRSAR